MLNGEFSDTSWTSGNLEPRGEEEGSRVSADIYGYDPDSDLESSWDESESDELPPAETSLTSDKTPSFPGSYVSALRKDVGIIESVDPRIPTITIKDTAYKT